MSIPTSLPSIYFDAHLATRPDLCRPGRGWNSDEVYKWNASQGWVWEFHRFICDLHYSDEGQQDTKLRQYIEHNNISEKDLNLSREDRRSYERFTSLDIAIRLKRIDFIMTLKEYKASVYDRSKIREEK